MIESEKPSAADRVQAAFREFEAPLLRYARRITGDPERARDAVQETFLAALKRWGGNPGPAEAHWRQWLFTVCRHRAIDIRRKETRMKPLQDAGEELFAANGVDSMAFLEQQETHSRVHQIIGGLPARQQEILFLKFQNGLSYQEIGKVMDLSISNVGFLIHVALKSVRDRFRVASRMDPGA